MNDPEVRFKCSQCGREIDREEQGLNWETLGTCVYCHEQNMAEYDYEMQYKFWTNLGGETNEFNSKR